MHVPQQTNVHSSALTIIILVQLCSLIHPTAPLIIESFLNFINHSPTPFHAVSNAINCFCHRWSVGWKWVSYVVGCHTDSPCFTIRPASRRTKLGYSKKSLMTLHRMANEEIGSVSNHGAESDLLEAILTRISSAFAETPSPALTERTGVPPLKQNAKQKYASAVVTTCLTSNCYTCRSSTIGDRILDHEAVFRHGSNVDVSSQILVVHSSEQKIGLYLAGVEFVWMEFASMQGVMAHYGCMIHGDLMHMDKLKSVLADWTTNLKTVIESVVTDIVSIVRGTMIALSDEQATVNVRYQLISSVGQNLRAQLSGWGE
ncbi:uncharacterized protein MELLADRAFT_111290 [Melampsora larici-populina 98AG31]|uniref:aspartyl aminopeptidase n=1 Tax=Melampsora larici-populina (strain 98AG31 / pathotype 3-4-7) TaxID=747676 RepID=F4S2N1_MELLP|nr:uncharacterized protein MELLADRAFT_111290 [Melampsora larici-populina 98AG31]EGG01100.1 hypothetical protein MELLADRAFT_111290 [Melampsora larici-populina 98AG31]